MMDVPYNKYVEVNQRDLYAAIANGIWPMLNNYDPKRNMLPYFGNVMSQGSDFGNSHDSGCSLSHIPGRWLNALLEAENTIDISVNDKHIEILRRWAFRSMEGDDVFLPVWIDTDTLDIIKKVDLHNLRETLLAFSALCQYRDDEKAYELAIKLIANADKYYDYKSFTFLYDKFTADTGSEVAYYDPHKKIALPFPQNFGRYIGALVKFYKATGSKEAISQAIRLKETCFDRVLNERGDYLPDLFGFHTHSTTSMISSLAQLGQIINDNGILLRVKNFMEKGLNEIALDFGWCIEGYKREDFVGEINNTTDILETCLILGHAGYTDYYARAEILLRNHILPSQLLDTSFIPEIDDVGDDSIYKMASRSRGAFGFPTPVGHEDHAGARISFNWDISGGGVSGLCEAYKHRVNISNHLISINMLFDYKDAYIKFLNPYDGKGKSIIVVTRQISIRIRMPRNIGDIKVYGCDYFIDKGWLYLLNSGVGCLITVDFDFQTSEQTYCFRNNRFTFQFKGEEVQKATSKGKRLCFFEALDER